MKNIFPPGCGYPEQGRESAREGGQSAGEGSEAQSQEGETT